MFNNLLTKRLRATLRLVRGDVVGSALGTNGNAAVESISNASQTLAERMVLQIGESPGELWVLLA